MAIKEQLLFVVSIILCYASYSLAQLEYDYATVISKSLLFYEAQRSGRLPGSNRIPWRRDTFLEDRGHNWEDLSGGYFDAGDFVKFGFPLASSMTILAWGMVDSSEGYRRAGQWEHALQSLRWGMDYMIKTHPSPNVLYVQVGNGQLDHAYWGRPEDWNLSIHGPRPPLQANQSKPASEVAGEYAAAMAASSIVFRSSGDNSYADTLLRHSRELYTFATTHRGHYNNSFPEVAEFYNSWSGYGDELAWASAWLYRATWEPFYQNEYRQHWNTFNLHSLATEASWDWKQAYVQVLLAKIDGGPQYIQAARSSCDWMLYSAPKTPKGLLFLTEWGSLRYAANAAFLLLQAANSEINPDSYRAFAKSQITYMLGDTGRSFVVGFGVNPPQRPHHASSSCSNPPAPCDWSDYTKPEPNPHTLNGALVGGPDRSDNYEDRRDDYVANEVALDYNAGFQGALADLCIRHCY